MIIMTTTKEKKEIQKKEEKIEGEYADQSIKAGGKGIRFIVLYPR